jgi:hypothetical protein
MGGDNELVTGGVRIFFDKIIILQDGWGRDKLCAQPENSNNVARRGSNCLVHTLGHGFTWLDYDLTRKGTLIPLLDREEVKYVHNHKIQQIFHNVARRGSNFLCTCWGVCSTSRTMIWPEKEHSFHFCTGKRWRMRTARKFKKYSTTWFAGG